MRKKSEAEMERARLVKVSRTLIRLKHSLAADQEINDTLPDTVAEFDEAYANGRLKRLQTGLSDVLGEV